MGATGWAMIVILVMADGSGKGVLLDQNTGMPAVFPTVTECVTELDVIRQQIMENAAFDIEKSTLQCIPDDLNPSWMDEL